MLLGFQVLVNASRKTAAGMNGERCGRAAQGQKTGTDGGIRARSTAGIADHIGFDIALGPGHLGRISLPRLTKSALRLRDCARQDQGRQDQGRQDRPHRSGRRTAYRHKRDNFAVRHFSADLPIWEPKL